MSPATPIESVVTVFQNTGQALLDDAVGAVVVALSILALFIGAEIASRWARLPVEWTRKATHVGSGVIVLAFPWLLQHTVTVGLLAASFGAILLGGKVTGLLGSIHNVERRTSGAYYYPLAVLGTWVVSGGAPLQFCVPLAIMAVADTGAALVGQRAGETTYRVLDGYRSLEGSMAFFGLAFTIVLVASSINGYPVWPATLLVALVVAVLTTAVESVSVRGSDNIGIPYAAWLAIEQTERLGLDALGDWVFGMILGAVLLIASIERARLDASGAIFVFLVASLSFALGGWAWFAPLAALYVGFLAARTPDANGLERVFPTTAGAVIIVLVWAHTGEEGLYTAYLAAVSASGAMGGVLIGVVRGWSRTVLGTAGALAPVLVAKLVAPESSFFAPLIAAGAAGFSLYVLRSAPPWGRRLGLSLFAALLGWALALLQDRGM